MNFKNFGMCHFISGIQNCVIKSRAGQRWPNQSKLIHWFSLAPYWFIIRLAFIKLVFAFQF